MGRQEVAKCRVWRGKVNLVGSPNTGNSGGSGFVMRSQRRMEQGVEDDPTGCNLLFEKAMHLLRFVLIS